MRLAILETIIPLIENRKRKTETANPVGLKGYPRCREGSCDTWPAAWFVSFPQLLSWYDITTMRLCLYEKTKSNTRESNMKKAAVPGGYQQPRSFRVHIRPFPLRATPRFFSELAAHGIIHSSLHLVDHPMMHKVIHGMESWFLRKRTNADTGEKAASRLS